MKLYIAQFPAGRAPKLWGLHNYVDVNSISRWGTTVMLRRAPGEIWFTETGAIISRRKPKSSARADRRKQIRTGESRSAAATQRVFTLAQMSERITRVYIYHWRAGPTLELGFGAVVARTARRGRRSTCSRTRRDGPAADAPRVAAPRGVACVRDTRRRCAPATAIAQRSSICSARTISTGRLTVEEFEQRIEQRRTAPMTLLELGDLHEDLPDLQPRRGKIVRRDTRAPRIPGLLPFVERVELRCRPRGWPAAQAFEVIAPALARHGYELRPRRRGRWPSTAAAARCGRILVAIFAFPIGLIALLHTGDRRGRHRDRARPRPAARRC